MISSILTQAVLCMALNIYHESRGEVVLGQMAVAEVTMNRANNDAANVCKIVTAPNQFSWYKSGTSLKDYVPLNSESWRRARMLAHLYVFKLAPPTGLGNLYAFHATNVKPYWSYSEQFIKVASIGNHIFYERKGKA